MSEPPGFGRELSRTVCPGGPMNAIGLRAHSGGGVGPRRSPMMKISHTPAGNLICVIIREEIDGTSCTCLEHYWDRFVSNPFDEVRVDMTEVDSIDSAGIAQMVTLLRRNLADGARVVLDAPPQTLAHTLYKAGMLEERRGITLANIRSEEPYAG